MKRWVLLLCLVIGIVLLIGVPYAINVYKMIQGFKHMPVQKETVSATKIGYQEWRPQLQAIGSLRAVRGADLSAEVAGIVDEIHFRSGDDVKAGDLLLTLRAADDLARLQALKATAALAETTYRRDQAQYEAQAISRQQLDSDEANLKAAQAQVVEQAALVAKKFVRAPFSGHLGLRAVDPGQYLAPGTKIVTLQQLDPIFVDFSLPQQSLGELAVGQSVDAVTDTFPGQHFAGRVDAIEPKVDTDTRNVQLRAELQNPQHRLLPGMYARVSIEVGQPQRYLTLPQTAVTYNPYGETVFVLIPQSQWEAEQKAAQKASGAEDPPPAKDAGAKPAGQNSSDQNAPTLVAKQVFVKTGPTRGDQVAILKGLEEGQLVVTSGQLKLKNGTPVDINNEVQPADEPHPTPQEQ